MAGNGKTLRTERLMAAFVEGWITMSGPSSAKAGMQGTPCPIAILRTGAHVLRHILVFPVQATPIAAMAATASTTK